MGEQNLCGDDVVLCKLGFVHLRQAHLSHRSSRLQFVDVRRTGVPIQAFHALGNRATGDQNHFFFQGAQCGNLRRPTGNRNFVQATSFVGDERGTHFNDHTMGTVQSTDFI